MTGQRSEQRRKLEEKGSRQTHLEDAPAFGETGPGEPGRAGGNLSRKVGTRQHQQNAQEQPGRRAQVRKSDERENG